VPWSEFIRDYLPILQVVLIPLWVIIMRAILASVRQTAIIMVKLETMQKNIDDAHTKIRDMEKRELER